jgi:hypothetical protein
MTKEDIIRMAREAGFRVNTTESLLEELERFAALVASAERERFADECIDLVASYGGPVDLEAAIRKRGQA